MAWMRGGCSASLRTAISGADHPPPAAAPCGSVLPLRRSFLRPSCGPPAGWMWRLCGSLPGARAAGGGAGRAEHQGRQPRSTDAICGAAEPLGEAGRRSGNGWSLRGELSSSTAAGSGSGAAAAGAPDVPPSRRNEPPAARCRGSGCRLQV